MTPAFSFLYSTEKGEEQFKKHLLWGKEDSSGVEGLPSKCKALVSIPSNTKEEKFTFKNGENDRDL